MSMMVNPARFGSAAVTPFGALAYRTTDQTVTGAVATTVQFTAEVYDVGSFHDTSSDTTRFTVPSAVSRVRFLTSLVSNASTVSLLEMLKNGSTFRGGARGEAETTGQDCVSIASAVVNVSAADYFEARGTVAASPFTADERTWGSIEVIDPTLRCALVYNTGTQALSAGVTTTLTWNAEEYDDAAFHDNSTNPSRLTVPSGVSLVKVSACIKGGNVADQLVLTFLKNGASARGLGRKDSDTASEENCHAISAVLEVTAGDYFECQAFSTNATSITADVEVWFAIEEIPSTWKRCLVRKTAGQTVTNTTAALTWDAEVYDPDNLHDNVTNNSRITAPSGATYARCSGNLTSSSAAANYNYFFRKNGSIFTGSGTYENDTAGTDNLNAMSAWVPCVAGDYFEAIVGTGVTGATFSTEDGNWFCVEFR